ncbi:MAG: hypothetical protein QM610_10260 [Chitinophagaceae bacterium]
MNKNPHDMQQVSDEERDFLLWRYLQKDLMPQELAQVQTRLDTDAVWQESLRVLQREEAQFQLLESETPSLRFTKNVMEAIEQKTIAKPARNYVNKNIVKWIVGSFMVVIVAFVVYAATQVQWTGGNAEKIDFKLPTISLSFHPNVNVGSEWIYGCFAIVVVCFFVLVDRFLFSKKEMRRRVGS